MARAPLREVRWLTLEELATEWARELHTENSIVLRELRRGYLNLSRMAEGQDAIGGLLEEEDLPLVTSQVDRQWVEQFAANNRWALPRFWFGDGPTGRPVGRPKLAGWHRIEQEMLRRIHEGEAKDSWRAESNCLADWIAEQIPTEQTPTAKSIREKFRHTRVQNS